jgi:hypothetical protein
VYIRDRLYTDCPSKQASLKALCYCVQAELEEQIRLKEAARQAAGAAARQREAAEAAARAAAPPPWDPVARVSRPGGGGEPLKAPDGSLVADLRGMKSK